MGQIHGTANNCSKVNRTEVGRRNSNSPFNTNLSTVHCPPSCELIAGDWQLLSLCFHSVFFPLGLCLPKFSL